MPEPPNSGPPRVWFITGASSGLGAALARAAHAAGDAVVCAQRDLTRLPLSERDDRVLGVSCHLSDPAALEAAVQQALDRFGRIDVLVNNAGGAIHGAVEEVDDREFRDLFEVNFFACLTLIKAVLPTMRVRGSGRIVNVSSIAGFSALGGSAAYSASKFALEGLSESLAQEVAPFGVRVVLVEPGSFRTDFRGRTLQYLERRIDAYAQTVGRLTAYAKANADNQPGDPAKAAAAIVAAVTHPDPPLRLLLGADAWRIAQAKLQSLAADFDAWRATTQGTDFDDAIPQATTLRAPDR